MLLMFTGGVWSEVSEACLFASWRNSVASHTGGESENEDSDEETEKLASEIDESDIQELVIEEDEDVCVCETTPGTVRSTGR